MNGDTIELFFTLVTAIFLEAAPFLLIGALIGSIIEVAFPAERLLHFVPKGRLKGIFLSLGAGMVLPTCECGVVPIVRRLMGKGVPPHMAVTYLLAAPVINPIVLISTFVAFRGNYWMVLGRVLLVSFPAVLIGLMFDRGGADQLVRDNGLHSGLPHHGQENGHHDHHACHHGHNEKAHACELHSIEDTRKSCIVPVILHTGSEFLDMSRFLVLGALAAAFFKIIIPQNLLAFLSQNVFISVASMMALAVLLSVCSEADAFVAGSFNSFSPLSQLSFVAIGPMVDLKLIGMYGVTFQRRLFLLLIFVPTIFVYCATLLIHALMEAL